MDRVVLVFRVAKMLALAAIVLLGFLFLTEQSAFSCSDTGGDDYQMCYNDCVIPACSGAYGPDLTACEARCASRCCAPSQ